MNPVSSLHAQPAAVRFGHQATATAATYQALFDTAIRVTEMQQIIANRRAKVPSRYRLPENNGWEIVQPNPRAPQIRILDDGRVLERLPHLSRKFHEVFPAGTVKLG